MQDRLGSGTNEEDLPYWIVNVGKDEVPVVAQENKRIIGKEGMPFQAVRSRMRHTQNTGGTLLVLPLAITLQGLAPNKCNWQ